MARAEREYAEALYLLAAEQGLVSEFHVALQEIRALLEECPLYLSFLSSPAISLDERRAAIDEAFSARYHEYVVSFLQLLCENGRIAALRDCIAEFERMVLELSGRAFAKITSAVELDDEQKKRLVLKMSEITGKEIDPVYETDPLLLGGVKVEVEGKTYDGTLKRRLRDVKDVMSQ